MKNLKLTLAIGVGLLSFTQHALAWSSSFTINNASNIDTFTVDRYSARGNWSCTNVSNGAPATPVAGQDAVYVNPLDGIYCRLTTNKGRFNSDWHFTNNTIPTEASSFTYYCGGTLNNCELPPASHFEFYGGSPSYLFTSDHDARTITFIPRSCPSIADVQTIINNGSCGKHFTYQGDSTWGIFCAVSSTDSYSNKLQSPTPTVTSFYGATIQSGASAECDYNNGNIIMHNDTTNVIFPTQGLGGWSVSSNTATCNGSTGPTGPTQCQWDETGE